MVRFFTGRWSCAGQFANGRRIESDLEFEPMLDGSWLQYRHTDRPPNHYAAVAM